MCLTFCAGVYRDSSNARGEGPGVQPGVSDAPVPFSPPRTVLQKHKTELLAVPASLLLLCFPSCPGTQFLTLSLPNSDSLAMLLQGQNVSNTLCGPGGHPCLVASGFLASVFSVRCPAVCAGVCGPWGPAQPELAGSTPGDPKLPDNAWQLFAGASLGLLGQ